MCYPQEMYLNQHKYVLNHISDAGLLATNSISTPLPKGSKFVAVVGPLLDEPVIVDSLVSPPP